MSNWLDIMLVGLGIGWTASYLSFELYCWKIRRFRRTLQREDGENGEWVDRRYEQSGRCIFVRPKMMSDESVQEIERRMFDRQRRIEDEK